MSPRYRADGKGGNGNYIESAPATAVFDLKTEIQHLAKDDGKNKQLIEALYNGVLALFKRKDLDDSATEGNELQKVVWEITKQQFETFIRANYDELTGLLRKNVFDERVIELAKTSLGKKCGALIFIDLNDIKAMNAKFGHEEVSKLLAEVGHAIDQNIRPYDSACRRGGDEYTICISNLPKETLGAQAADRIFKKIANIQIELTTLKGEKVMMRPSLSMGVKGIKEMRDIGSNLETYLNQADSGVNALKQKGGASKFGICVVEKDSAWGSLREYNAENGEFQNAENIELKKMINPETELVISIRRALTSVMEPCLKQKTGLAPAPIEESVKKLAYDIRTNCY